MTATGPTCRVVLDLRGVPWAKDAELAARLLAGRPGVRSARVDPVSGRAVVVHDARLSLPELWNWLVECGAHCSGERVPHHDCCVPEGQSAESTSVTT